MLRETLAIQQESLFCKPKFLVFLALQPIDYQHFTNPILTCNLQTCKLQILFFHFTCNNLLYNYNNIYIIYILYIYYYNLDLMHVLIPIPPQ